MSPHPDHEHILALRKGDFRILDQIYGSHAPTVTSWVLKNNGDLDEAKDVFQEGILALHRKANDPNFVLTCPIGALLFRICQKQWLYVLRKKKREAEVRAAAPPPSDQEGSVHQMLEAVEEESIHQHKLKTAFAELSDLCRQLLQLLAQGRSGSEIAQQLEMSGANTVYRRRHACGKRWRELYEQVSIQGIS